MTASLYRSFTPRSVDTERSCVSTGGANGFEGELCRHRPPSLCPPAHHSPSRACRAAQDCIGKARRQGVVVNDRAARGSCPRAYDCCYGRSVAAHVPRRCSASRAASRVVVLSRALWCMERLLAELKLAQHAHHAALTHSPFAPAAGPSWGPLCDVRCMHVRSV